MRILQIQQWLQIYHITITSTEIEVSSENQMHLKGKWKTKYYKQITSQCRFSYHSLYLFIIFLKERSLLCVQ